MIAKQDHYKRLWVEALVGRDAYAVMDCRVYMIRQEIEYGNKNWAADTKFKSIYTAT